MISCCLSESGLAKILTSSLTMVEYVQFHFLQGLAFADYTYFLCLQFCWKPKGKIKLSKYDNMSSSTVFLELSALALYGVTFQNYNLSTLFINENQKKWLRINLPQQV